MGLFWEKKYPFFLALGLSIILYLIDFSPKVSGFDKVLDGVITFTSIVIGFLAALLAIILSISKSKVMKHLYEHIDESNGKNILFSYFKQSIVSGFVLVLLSICMHIIHLQNDSKIYSEIIFWIWTYSAGFFVLTAYRIINVLMTALFVDAKISHTPEPKQRNLMSQDELDDFKKLSSRKE